MLNNKRSIFVLVLIIAISAVFLFLRNINIFDSRVLVALNYGDEIEKSAAIFNIDPSYLKALCVLESSGEKPAAKRFEKKVFKKLKLLRDRKISIYNGVTYSMIKNASDEALKNLATSWGPFQLMGYHCLLLGINVSDIRGDSTVFYSVKWINRTYGNYLRKGKYADAFHMHNRGIPVPSDGRLLTYNTKYVPRGLSLMKYFQE